MIITLPLPPRELSPNARPTRWAKAKVTKKYRRFAWAVAMARIGRGKAPRWKRATARATFYVRTVRTRDDDNLATSLKPAWDGLADAGIVVNDAGITRLPPVVAMDRDNPRVEIEITEDVCQVQV